MILRLLVIGLYVAAAITALLLSRRDARHHPVAWYLSAVLVLDVARMAAELCLLPPPADPYQGWLLAVRHLDQGLYLALLLAGPALAVAMFTGLRSRWPIAGLWGLLWLVVVAGYPELRGDALLELYSAVEAAGAIGSLLLFARWAWRHPSELSEVPPAVSATVVLLAASLVLSVLPSLAGALTVARWPASVGVTGVALAMVLGLQVRALWSAGS